MNSYPTFWRFHLTNFDHVPMPISVKCDENKLPGNFIFKVSHLQFHFSMSELQIWKFSRFGFPNVVFRVLYFESPTFNCHIFNFQLSHFKLSHFKLSTFKFENFEITNSMFRKNGYNNLPKCSEFPILRYETYYVPTTFPYIFFVKIWW